ncbi:hypothetical protein KLF50_14970 (plasmid) [Clostridium perfringens]|uniref:hypothetical protein n=1 Tax=Clostridium perfringens TaxID=1502 RepID=UPI001CC98E3C|nr:hypothetical protein [Clostridium perfringens]UBK83466.1 hypothetical protein KLF50_14970 [Clostridium perfringens]
MKKSLAEGIAIFLVSLVLAVALLCVFHLAINVVAIRIGLGAVAWKFTCSIVLIIMIVKFIWQDKLK